MQNDDMATQLMKKEKKKSRNCFFSGKPPLLLNRCTKKLQFYHWEETGGFHARSHRSQHACSRGFHWEETAILPLGRNWWFPLFIARRNSHCVTPLRPVVMAPPVHQEVELEEEKDLLCKCKRPKFSGSIVQSRQEIKVPAMEKENKVSVDKKPMDGVTDYVVQSTGEGNGFSKGVHGSASKGPAARSRLNTMCSAIGWKDPLYEFEEQGPPHNKLFTCKVTVHVDTITSTVVESFSEPKRQKKAALEHAAQGALWCLERFGHVN